MTPLAKIEEIALYLGKPWKFSRLESSNWRFEIIDGTGRGLCLRLDGDKIRISGIFPRHKCRAYSSDYQTIGVSMARHSKDIAADILRRLMPDYLKAYEVVQLRYTEEQAQKEHLHLITQSIVKVSQGRMAGHGRTQRMVYFEQGEVQIWSGGDVTLNLKKLSVTQAMRIISFLQEGEP